MIEKEIQHIANQPTLSMPNLIIVGGAKRNLGKTHLVGKLIQALSEKTSVTALKIKSLYSGDKRFHGSERNPLRGHFSIQEASYSGENEDTARMLKAGASSVFKIKSKGEHLGQAFAEWQKLHAPKDGCIVCESNSLRFFVQPAYFILIKGNDPNDMKPTARKVQTLANLIVLSDGRSTFKPMPEVILCNVLDALNLYQK